MILRSKYLIVIAISLIVSCSPVKRVVRDDIEADEKIYSRYQDNSVLESTEGVASFYSKRHNGKRTASGEIFNMNNLTASHKTYPFGTIIRVTNLINDHSVILRVNDRMPLRNKRMIDLSYRAAKELNMIRSGTTKVKIEVLKWGK
jgi:rare lipoprotein A